MPSTWCGKRPERSCPHEQRLRRDRAGRRFAGRALRGCAGRGRLARGCGGARAGRRRVLVLGVYPVEDAAAAGRGGRTARAKRRASAEVDVEAALAWRDFMVSDYSDAGQERWLADNGIELLRGTGRLAGPGVVEVDGVRHTADHVVLANGADPVVPPVPGLRELEGVWTNREATSMKAIPRRLLDPGRRAGRGRDGAGRAPPGRRGGARRWCRARARPRAGAAGRGAGRGPAPRRHRARPRRTRDRGASRRRGLRPGARRRPRAARRPPARRDRPAPARRRARPRDGRDRARRPRNPCRRAPARRRAPVGDRRHQRQLAADPRRQVRGRGRRGQHPRRAARGPLRSRAARHLHRPPGRRRSARPRPASAAPPPCPSSPRPRPTRAPTPSRTASSPSSATASG